MLKTTAGINKPHHGDDSTLKSSRIDLGMEIPDWTAVIGRTEVPFELPYGGQVDAVTLLESEFGATGDPEILQAVIGKLRRVMPLYDEAGLPHDPSNPLIDELNLPRKNGQILVLPQAEIQIGGTGQGLPDIQRALKGTVYKTDYLINWAYQSVGRDLAEQDGGILSKSTSEKLVTCSVGSINVSLTAFVKYFGDLYALGHHKAPGIMVQPKKVHGSLLPGGAFGDHLDSILSESSDSLFTPAGLSTVLNDHVVTKWSITPDKFNRDVEMDIDDPILISELVELGYFQFGYIAKAIKPEILAEMLLIDRPFHPSLKIKELALIPLGNDHSNPMVWSMSAENTPSGPGLVVSGAHLEGSGEFVGYARALRDAAVMKPWFLKLAEANAIEIADRDLPIRRKLAA